MPGEPFVDVNKDGQYNGPNGQWDSSTVIWAETRILYSGIPRVENDGSGNELFSRFYSEGALTQPPTSTPAVSFGVYNSTPPLHRDQGHRRRPGDQYFGIAFMDGNFNPISSIATYGLAPLGTGVVSAAFSIEPRQNLSWDGTSNALGMSFTQQYCDKQAATVRPSARTCAPRRPATW